MPAQIPPRALTTLAVGLALAALISGTLASPASADPVDTDDDAAAAPKVGRKITPTALPDTWFVQVSGAPSLRGGNRATATRHQARVQKAAHDDGVDLSVLHTYTRVWNGFSVQASSSDVAKLRSVPGVTAVYPVLTVQLAEQTGTTVLKSSLPTIRADIAQNQGFKGDGIKVGVIDSGIDYNHRDLSGSGTPGNNADFGLRAPRVKYGYDFVGDNYRPGTPGGEPMPDAYPDDCSGQGTSVAGIIGGDGSLATNHILGVAPHVTFGAYRVFGCDGTSDTGMILAAMDRAAADRMDVVNLPAIESLDSWPGNPLAAAADALTDAGTLVVAPVGTSDAGLFSSGGAAVARKVISVANVQPTDFAVPAFSVSPVPVGRNAQVGYVHVPFTPAVPTSGASPLAVGNAGNTRGCGPLSGVSGKTVLLQIGECDPRIKVLNAIDAGATGVVIYNDASGWVMFPSVPGPRPITISAVNVSQIDGEALAAQVAAGTATTLTWSGALTNMPNPGSGLLKGGSFGLAADLTLTPDVVAPDGVRSTVPIEQNSYADRFATAAAHVTGAVALMIQAGRRVHVGLQGDAARVRAALQNTALPVRTQNTLGTSTVPVVYEPPIRQGAGLIQVDKAIDAALSSTTVTPGKISLGQNRDTYRKTTLTLTNYGTSTRTYTLSVQHSASVGPRPTTYWYDHVNKVVPAKFSSPTVTVEAGKTATVAVSILQPPLTTGWIYGGWVQLTRTDGGSTLVVPFAGMFGDYQSVKVLQDSFSPRWAGPTPVMDVDLPGLSTRADAGGIVSPSAPKPVFTMQDADSRPHLLFHLDYPVSTAYFNVYKATPDGKKGGEVFTGRKTFLELGKQGRDAGYQDRVFDGKIPFSNGSPTGLTVPNGDYVLELRVLKALGNPDNPNHWETYVSPAFTIQRTP